MQRPPRGCVHYILQERPGPQRAVWASPGAPHLRACGTSFGPPGTPWARALGLGEGPQEMGSGKPRAAAACARQVGRQARVCAPARIPQTPHIPARCQQRGGDVAYMGARYTCSAAGILLDVHTCCHRLMAYCSLGRQQLPLCTAAPLWHVHAVACGRQWGFVCGAAANAAPAPKALHMRSRTVLFGNERTVRRHIIGDHARECATAHKWRGTVVPLCPQAT